jgi:hypothetical protein
MNTEINPKSSFASERVNRTLYFAPGSARLRGVEAIMQSQTSEVKKESQVSVSDLSVSEWIYQLPDGTQCLFAR